MNSEWRIPLVDLRAQFQEHRDEIFTSIRAVIEDAAFVRGEYVERFEREFAAACGASHCVSVANGTDALFVALKMLGVGPGDEVVTVANTWISTAEAISLTGAQPVFVDIEPQFYNIDCSKIERALTSRTKAVVPVHLFGQPADMEVIQRLCEREGLLLIEDCAQAHLAEYRAWPVGTLGNAGTFSFYPGKNLGAYGDAGAIITNDEHLATRMRMFANHGSRRKHEHEFEGINSRLDGIQAAVLSVKLPYLDGWTRARQKHASRLSQLLADVREIVVPETRANCRHVFHVYCIRARYRDELRDYLSERGVTSAIHYPKPLPFLPAYRSMGHTQSDFPVAADYQSKILSLPMYPELSDSALMHIADTAKSFYATKLKKSRSFG